MTEYAWIDRDGTERLRGTIDPAPGLPSGSGSPVGVVTPSGVGALYIDTTNGAIYLATGVTNTDWVVFGVDPNAIGGTAGIEIKASDRSLAVLAGHQDTPLNGSAVLSDAYSYWNGNSNGLEWVGNGTDGQQILQVRTGGNLGTLQDKDGNMSPAGTVIDLPDPTNAQDAATKAYADTKIAQGGTLSADLDVNGNDLLNVASVEGAGGTNQAILSSNSEHSVQVSTGGVVVGTTVGAFVGFFGHAPAAQPTGVAVDAAGIHAALVALGLITA